MRQKTKNLLRMLFSFDAIPWWIVTLTLLGSIVVLIFLIIKLIVWLI